MPRQAPTKNPPAPAPAQTLPPVPTTAPTIPAPAAAPAPVLVSPTATWPTLTPAPTTQPNQSDTPKTRRTSGGRGMPVGPVLASAGNATGLTLTTAYQYGGPVAAATTGALMAAGATAVALRKRATVKRSMASRGGSTGSLRGATGGGGRGAAVASRMGSGGALRGATKNGRGGSGGATKGPLRGAMGTGAGRLVAPRKGGATGSAFGSAGTTTDTRGGATKRGGGLLGASGRGATKGSLLGGGKHRKDGATNASRHGALRHGNAGRHDKQTGPGTGTRHNPNTPTSPSKSNKQGGNNRAHTLKAAIGRATRSAATGTGNLIARGARAAWNGARNKTRSLAKAATAGLARQIKKIPGALADGLIATSAGLLSGLWHWSLSAAGSRIKDVWRKLRARRARKQEAKAAAAEAAVAATTTDTTPAAPTAHVGGAARRPLSSTFTRPTTNGGTLMSGGHHFVAPAMEMARIAAAYQPQGMLQVGEDFAGLSEALGLHAEAMKVTVENADASWPLDPGVIDLMRQIYSLQIKAAELAQELKPAFEQLHGVDLDRLRNPRKSAAAEAMWDVRTNL
ncbi:hypothetical protein [Streptomyces cinereoruber]|uniref:hypothetical protein n=1 Tax=Streptomyces cinereoruber TaxID=67260 RepID=UPI00362A8FFA